MNLTFDRTLALYCSIKKSLKAVMPELQLLKQERTLKDDSSYVTKGDLLIQELIREMIIRHDPEATLISEEDKESHRTMDYKGSIYVLDPVDGTENFTSGLPEWGVSLSHYKGGQHVASMIACPELNLWLSSGEEWQRFRSRIRGLSSSLGKKEFDQLENGYEYRIIGCCVYNMLCVLRGSFYSFENPKGVNTWDILGGLNLALEKGLSVTVEGMPYQGEFLPPNRKYRFRISNENLQSEL